MDKEVTVEKRRPDYFSVSSPWQRGGIEFSSLSHDSGGTFTKFIESILCARQCAKQFVISLLIILQGLLLPHSR